MGNISPFCMMEYFQGLDRDIVTMKGSQPLLNALNQAEVRADTLESGNQLLKDHIEKVEQEFNVLTGKRPTLHSLIGQVCDISIDDNDISEVMDLVEQENKNSKSVLEASLMKDSLKLYPIITQKTKKVQDRPARVP